MNMRALAIAAFVALGVRPASAGVTTVDFTSDTSLHHLAAFDGKATYDSTTGKLTIDVHNTTATGGFLTSLALDATGPTAAYEAAAGFGISDLRNKKGIVNASPFGKYHAGAGTNGNWSAAAGASHGVAAGRSSENFVFDVAGPNASSLTVADFLTPGKTGQEIVATFKKLEHHRGDRAGALMSGAVTTVGSGSSTTPTEQPVFDPVLIPPPPPPGGNLQTSAVPVPPAVWMALTTAALVVALRRKLKFALA